MVSRCRDVVFRLSGLDRRCANSPSFARRTTSVGDAPYRDRPLAGASTSTNPHERILAMIRVQPLLLIALLSIASVTRGANEAKIGINVLLDRPASDAVVAELA